MEDFILPATTELAWNPISFGYSSRALPFKIHCSILPVRRPSVLGLARTLVLFFQALCARRREVNVNVLLNPRLEGSVVTAVFNIIFIYWRVESVPLMCHVWMNTNYSCFLVQTWIQLSPRSIVKSSVDVNLLPDVFSASVAFCTKAFRSHGTLFRPSLARMQFFVVKVWMQMEIIYSCNL